MEEKYIKGEWRPAENYPTIGEELFVAGLLLGDVRDMRPSWFPIGGDDALEATWRARVAEGSSGHDESELKELGYLIGREDAKLAVERYLGVETLSELEAMAREKAAHLRVAMCGCRFDGDALLDACPKHRAVPWKKEQGAMTAEEITAMLNERGANYAVTPDGKITVADAMIDECEVTGMSLVEDGGKPFTTTLDKRLPRMRERAAAKVKKIEDLILTGGREQINESLRRLGLPEDNKLLNTPTFRRFDADEELARKADAVVEDMSRDGIINAKQADRFLTKVLGTGGTPAVVDYPADEEYTGKMGGLLLAARVSPLKNRKYYGTIVEVFLKGEYGCVSRSEVSVWFDTGTPSDRWLEEYDCTRKQWDENAEVYSKANNDFFSAREIICDTHYESDLTYAVAQAIAKAVNEMRGG